MAEDKQDEPKGQNTGGWASFLYSPQQTPQKICFDGATFCRKPPGLIATTHCLKTLYLWRFQPTASPAVTQPLASISERRTPTQRKNDTRLAPKIRKLGSKSGKSTNRCRIFRSVTFTDLLYLASPAFCRNVNLDISCWATFPLKCLLRKKETEVFSKKKHCNTTKIHCGPRAKTIQT